MSDDGECTTFENTNTKTLENLMKWIHTVSSDQRSKGNTQILTFHRSWIVSETYVVFHVFNSQTSHLSFSMKLSNIRSTSIISVSLLKHFLINFFTDSQGHSEQLLT